jgi:hypothetical protein
MPRQHRFAIAPFMKTKSLRMLLVTGLVASLFGLTACSNSTQLETVWKAPEVGSIQFTKVMVLAIAPDGATRRTAEDAMKAQVTGIPVVASYEVLPDMKDQKDRTKVARAMREAGVDGIVVMRAVSDDTEVSYSPGGAMPMPYRSFWGYYTPPYAMQPMYWDAPTITTDRILGIETNIYNAKDEMLIWSGYTKTTNPGKIDALVAEVAGVVRAKLREQKLIP